MEAPISVIVWASVPVLFTADLARLTEIVSGKTIVSRGSRSVVPAAEVNEYFSSGPLPWPMIVKLASSRAVESSRSAGVNLSVKLSLVSVAGVTGTSSRPVMNDAFDRADVGHS